MSLVGLATPASSDTGEITAAFTPHCTYGRLAVTNGTDAPVEVRIVVAGDEGEYVTLASGADHVFRVENPTGQTIALEKKGTDGSPQPVDSFTNAKPERCDDFAVTFTDSCDSTTVSVTNNHDDVYLRIYAPGVPTVVHQGAFGFEDTFTDTFPMSAGDKMIVEITFGAGGLIDYVAEHEFVATGCQPEPEFPATIEDTCTGIKVTVTNDSQEPLPVEVRRADAAPGDEPLHEFVVPAGETVTEEVEVADGVEIVLTGYDNQVDLGRHKVDLKDCPDLPKTGTDVMTIVLAGLGVLIVGAGVLFGLHLARRRKLSEQ